MGSMLCSDLENEKKPYVQKIVTEKEWIEAKKVGFIPRSIKDKNFIHCNFDHQSDTVIKKYFSDQNCYILTLSRDCLGSRAIAIVKENDYPHLYPLKNVDLIPFEAVLTNKFVRRK